MGAPRVINRHSSLWKRPAGARGETAKKFSPVLHHHHHTMHLCVQVSQQPFVTRPVLFGGPPAWQKQAFAWRLSYDSSFAFAAALVPVVVVGGPGAAEGEGRKEKEERASKRKRERPLVLVVALIKLSNLLYTRAQNEHDLGADSVAGLIHEKVLSLSGRRRRKSQ